MPRYNFKNRTANKLHIPFPVNAFMPPHGTLVVDIPAAEMENNDIKRMVKRGLLSVAAQDDVRLSDDLEVPVLSMITGGHTPVGPAGGDLTGTYPNPTLVLTGVTPGTYGSASQVPVLIVDAKGRVTGASLVNVSQPAVFSYTQVTANYVTTLNDVFIAVDASGGPVTITLHAASLLLGKRIHVKKIDQSSNFVTVVPTGVDVVDNGPSFRWNFYLNSYIFCADGVSKWWIT